MQYKIAIKHGKSRSKHGGAQLTLTCGDYKSQATGGGYDMMGMCLAHIAVDMFPEYFGVDSPFQEEDIQKYYGLYKKSDGTWYIYGADEEVVELLITELMGFKLEWVRPRDKDGRSLPATHIILEK